MKKIIVNAGPFRFVGRLEEEKAPRTCQRFIELLPFRNKVIHSRWSGEAVWIPLGDFDTGLTFENHTSHASRGDILLYPGGFSETEFLFVYGSSIFASKMGQLAGNHFFTLLEGHEHLEAFGKLVLWEGAQDIEFSLADN
ncbi:MULTISPECIES: DUF3830 family protein [Paraburkholderia]|jgi:hypothetical protein|uniref:DUF3830 family protein n=1 Tax=Paraburkholderia TaxID=1822464 RepID=UPI000DEEBF1F|nr:DUF3830 family protein [Paraburkholderia hospita]AXF05032.1 DUF3830 domain-containing protein [Paraburkholderia hospita]